MTVLIGLSIFVLGVLGGSIYGYYRGITDGIAATARKAHQPRRQASNSSYQSAK